MLIEHCSIYYNKAKVKIKEGTGKMQMWVCENFCHLLVSPYSWNLANRKHGTQN